MKHREEKLVRGYSFDDGGKITEAYFYSSFGHTKIDNTFQWFKPITYKHLPGPHFAFSTFETKEEAAEGFKNYLKKKIEGLKSELKEIEELLNNKEIK